MRPHPGEGCFGGFLHDVAQLARQMQASLARHGQALNLQHFAADGGVCQAVDHADAGLLLRHFTGIAGRAQVGAQHIRGHADLGDALVQHGDGSLAHHLGHGALQRAHTGLTGVALDELTQHLVRHAHGFRRQAMGFDLLGHQVALADLQLLLLSIGGHLDDLHAIQQRAGDGIDAVGGGDEHHPAQVEGQLQIVVAEGAVLLRVQHLQQAGGRIAAVVVAHLVDLVKEEHGVHRTRLLEAGNDPPRDRPQVRPAMTANFRLVPHAAQGHLHEPAAHGLGNGADDGRFAHAGRPDKAQNRALHVLLHPQHGQVLDNALLDLFQAIMILGQHLSGTLEVEVIRGGLAPGQVKNPLDIGARHADLRRTGRHA